MKTEEIIQVLELHLDSLKTNRRKCVERGTYTELTEVVLTALSHEIQACSEAVEIITRALDDEPLTLDQLRRTDMDYNELAKDVLQSAQTIKSISGRLEFYAAAITDLLTRAESAEARCETLEKMVKEYQEVIIPGYREQAEKAEREQDAAVKEE